MNLFEDANVNEEVDMERINEKLISLYKNGEFDFDGDGNSSEIDAKLLIRYFMGRTGDSLTRNLVDRFLNFFRKVASDIISYLDERTENFLGRDIR